MPEGQGNMFDNTVIMYLPENGEKHHSVGTHVPFLILSGKNVKMDIAGRYIQLPAYDQKDHKTLGNWYTTILNAYGNPISHYGDLDVGLKIKQEGPISITTRTESCSNEQILNLYERGCGKGR